MQAKHVKWSAGVDEVGRGPLAGPVVAAAVVLPADYHLPGLTDSKRVPPRRRVALAEILRNEALAWALGEASAVEIDTLNIHHASLLAMERAVRALAYLPEHLHLLVDGRFAPTGPWTATPIVGGDALEPAISAASILAKVARDAWMQDLHRRYPVYGFDRHAGYPTRVHLQALAEQGPCSEHRRSFAPVARALAGMTSAVPDAGRQNQT